MNKSNANLQPQKNADIKVHVASMRPPGVDRTQVGPHVGPMNLALRESIWGARQLQWNTSPDLVVLKVASRQPDAYSSIATTRITKVYLREDKQPQ